MESVAQTASHHQVVAQKDRVSKAKNLVLYLTIFLLPSLFWQSQFIGSYAVKITLLATSLVLLVVTFFVSVLSERSFSVPKSKIYIPLALFMAGILISSLFSGALEQSFSGTVFDLGTSGSLLILSGIFIAVSVLVRKESVIKMSVFAFLASQLLTLFYLLVRTASIYVAPSFAAKLNVLPAGGVTNTAILMGVAIIIAVCLLAAQLSRKMSVLLWAIVVGGTVFVGASGFTPAIVLLGLFSVVYFVYLISWNMGGGASPQAQSTERRISVPSLFVLAASVVFLISGNVITGSLSGMMQISSLEVRPNIETTFSLISQAWKESPILGVGPNRFAEFWAKNKPVEINLSDFWTANFSFGYGFVPTIAVTTGIVGLVPLLAFIFMFIYKGFKAVFMPSQNENSRFLFMAVFLSVVYLWLMTFAYVPDITVLGLTFIFSGLCAAAWASRNVEARVKVEMFSNPKTNFVSVLSIVVLLIMSVVAGYFVWERTMAARLFGQGTYLASTGKIEEGQAKMIQALNAVQTDVYWRGVSEVSLLKFNNILQRESANSQLSEGAQAELQTVIGEAVESVRQAVNLNPENYVNWVALANTYEVLASNGVEGSLESAKTAYGEALTRSPGSPALYLALGRVEAMSQNLEVAKEHINKAIELKRNYTDAHFAMAQIEAAANNLPGAIRSVENAAVTDPNNAGLFFQLGMLKYGDQDFAGAEVAFKRAIVIIPDYANAKYFLGLTYHSLGKKEEAIKEFEEIKASNPDNTEIELILNNLQEGKNPFYGAKPPANQNPVERPEPPIEE